MINIDIIKRISAKIKLQMPLSAYEEGILKLYPQYFEEKTK